MGKPSGKLGAFKAVTSEQGVHGEFEKVVFSKEKDEIENSVVKMFFDSMNKELGKTGEQFVLKSPKRLSENDFDFEVTSPKGKAYLELVEYAPPSLVSKGFNKVPVTYAPFERAVDILKAVLKKDRKYPSRRSYELFLLVYVTHFGLAMNKTCQRCLQYFLSKAPISFDCVYFYTPLANDFGEPLHLFPVPPILLQGFSPWLCRENTVIHLDPEKFFVVGKEAPKSSTGDNIQISGTNLEVL